MSNNEYAPTVQSVRDGFVWLSAEDNPVGRELAGEDFDRFLAQVKRDAWQEGMLAGDCAAYNGHTTPPNPYEDAR